MRKTKLALLHSVIALILCCSMLIGTTFAWFTDSVSSGVNHIMAGNLDVELEYWANGTWKTVNGSTEIFDPNALWEPGYTEVVYLRVSNKGSLALKYQLGVNIVSETGSINQAGDPFLLSSYIHFGAIDMKVVGEFAPYATRDDARKAVNSSKLISEGYSKADTIGKDGAAQYVALVVYMPEETGNVANYQTGVNPPSIDLGVKLVATQMTAESDSFGPTYDNGAAFPKEQIKFSVAQTIAANAIENGTLKQDVTIGDTNGDIYAEVPSGVKLAEGAAAVGLSVNTLEESKATIELSDGEVALPLDIHMDGVAEDNTVPMLITLEGLLRKGLNNTSVSMYHVEDGTTVAMTLVALSELDAHNEFYYDPATGDVTLCVASFSEYVPVVDNKNLWEGGFDYTWYVGKSSPYTISSADQLAAFGKIVDGTADGIEADTFKDKVVYLGNDIDLSGGVSFNPIGCGYADDSINSNGVTGRVFSGTFDGQGNTISGLYQNGWDLGLSYCNLGGGLFASIANGTVMNLTISGANIVMECVEMGVVAGLVQGNCTFDNINIYGCKIANYQKATGGLIGEVSGSGTTTISNVDIDSTTVVGSLWGDFDAPVGGVIGARWDNENADPKIEMTNVNVACRLDVYNDVTSAYQWYAYRRAGMLIGNTEESKTESGRTEATASFLKCENCVVIYGNWVKYHYCQFTNQTDTWCNNYPWVRAEAGENCSAFSNPRYGQPVIGTTTIADSQHTHSGNDEHLVQLTFDQLYGGGQGVYGGNAHIDNGVTIGKYTITYMDHGEILHVDYVIDNTSAYTTIWDISNVTNSDGNNPSCWVDANNKEFTRVAASNTSDVIVYPKWPNEYVVRCIDTKGNVVYYDFFTDDNTTDEEYDAIATQINETLGAIQSEVDASRKVIVVKWKNSAGNLITSVTADYLKDASADVILTATPELQEGSISLTPIYDETTGELVAYEVSSVVADDSNINVVIPPYVGTIPVTTISDNAAAGFDNLHVVVIPSTVTVIGSAAFSDARANGSGETVTIYYQGSRSDWENKVTRESGWDNGLGAGTRIFFLNGGDVIDTTQGYLERYATKNYFVYYEYDWKDQSAFTSTLKDEYTGDCDCGCGTRPDAAYWEGVSVS